jgi:DNA-binding winged helix-turn-helix (wHTH) protein/tetratricopeptide (TPR) repeat protein
MASHKTINFDVFSLDTVNELLWQGSHRIDLRPKTYALLQYLAEHPGQLLMKNDLMNALWQGTHVGEEALKHCVAEIRKALNDSAESPRYIETVHRRGYRFIGKIGSQAAAARKQETSRKDSDQKPIAFGNPLVGRASELAKLNHFLARAMAGTRQIVFVSGDQGIGKTSLVDAFLDAVNSGGLDQLHEKEKIRPVIARGQCVKSHGPSEAYMPLLEAFTGLCSLPDRDRILTALRRYAPLWLIQMPSLLRAAQLRTLRRRTQGSFPERMPREMAEALEALTSETPLILVLEDLHWSDYSTLDLLSYFAQRRGEARLLVIATYRPMEALVDDHPLKAIKQELEARQQCQEISVSHLNKAAVGEYLKQRFPGNKFPVEMAAWLHQRTGANPLFMVTVLDHLVAAGFIARRNKHWILSTSMQNAELTVPQTVHQVIERQLERLDAQEQLLLQAASVEGVEFSVSAVASVLGEKADLIEKRCRGMSERNLLLRPSSMRMAAYGMQTVCYSFTHALYQNTCYQLLPEEQRTQFHRLVAEHMEKNNEANLGELSARLAMHFDQGREPRHALRYYQQAADNANSRYAGREALELATRGLQLLESIPYSSEHIEREMSLRIALGTALMTVRGIGAGEVSQAFSRARDLFQQLTKHQQSSKKALLFSSLFGLWNYHWVRAEYAVTRELAEQLLQMAESEHKASMLNQAHHSLGIIMMDHGEFAGAYEHLKQCSGVISRCLSALTVWNLGFPDRARKDIEETLAFAIESRHLENCIFAYLGAARVYLARRESQKALDHAQSAMDLALDHGLVEQWLVPMRFIHGWALAKLGQAHNGLEQARQALAVVQSIGVSNLMSLLLAIFAEITMDAGQNQEGLAAVDKALQVAQSTGMHHCDAEIYRLKGELLLSQAGGHPAFSLPDRKLREAETSFEQAIEIARQQQARSWELRATTSLARLWQKQNRRTEAHNRLSKIYKWFTEGHDTPDLQDARELLKQLA